MSAKRYRYTGVERDSETGLALHGVRFYANWLCTWLRADPLGLQDGVNRYRYAANSPGVRLDVEGTTAPYFLLYWMQGDTPTEAQRALAQEREARAEAEKEARWGALNARLQAERAAEDRLQSDIDRGVKDVLWATRGGTVRRPPEEGPPPVANTSPALEAHRPLMMPGGLAAVGVAPMAEEYALAPGLGVARQLGRRALEIGGQSLADLHRLNSRLGRRGSIGLPRNPWNRFQYLNAGKFKDTAEAAQAWQASRGGGSAARRLSKEVEQATLGRLDSLLPDRTLRKSPNADDEWIDDLGQLYDQMGNPNMIPHWDKQSARFMDQIDIHLGKTDFTVIDLTEFPQHIIDDVNARLGTLSQQDLDRIIKVGF